VKRKTRRTPEPAARPSRADARDRRIIELERENRRLSQALSQLQERVSQLLGIPLERDARD
jgi:FtsZ-binding cell division protein ZapB